MTERAISQGKRISLLGYGAMRFLTVDGGTANGWAKSGYSPKPVDQELLNRQVKMMLDGGIAYFDTAPVYCRGESETCLGKALAASGYPRSSYMLASKLSNFAASQFSLEACKALLANSLKALQTDYLDNYVIHNTGHGGFETFKKRVIENGVVDWLLTERAAGRIRNLGFSYHGDRRAFDWCLEQHARVKWDFAMIQLNFVDWEHPANDAVSSKELYEALTRRGIPVIVMEPLRGGSLARFNQGISRELTPLDPEATQAKWAFRFCGSLPNVICVLSGMDRTEFIRENLKTFSPLKPCSEKELAALARAAEAYLRCGAVPCTRCNYCMPCPYGLDIPAILAYRNRFLVRDEGRSAGELLKEYARAVPDEMRRAEHCTGCGRCETHCPQSIEIAKEMASVDHVIDILKAEVFK